MFTKKKKEEFVNNSLWYSPFNLSKCPVYSQLNSFIIIFLWPPVMKQKQLHETPDISSFDFMSITSRFHILLRRCFARSCKCRFILCSNRVVDWLCSFAQLFILGRLPLLMPFIRKTISKMFIFFFFIFSHFLFDFQTLIDLKVSN